MFTQLRRRSSLLGVLVPLALLAGQLSTVVHLMLVEHQRCPEHGELIHRLPHDAPAPTLVGLSVASNPIRHQTLAAAVLTDREGDDHCVSLASRREIAGAPPRTSADLPPAPRCAIAADGDGSSHDRDALLLRLAPKTSPPPSA